MNPDLDDGHAGSVVSAALTFAALSEDPHRCRWPLEDGWCGAATVGRHPYCASHLESAYLPREPELEREVVALENASPHQPNMLEAI